MAKGFKKVFIGIAILIVLLLVCVFFWYQNRTKTVEIPGYIEANLSYISPQRVSGRLIDLVVSKGQKVKKGQTLFVIDPTAYKLQYEASVFQTKSNQSNYEDLLTGKREPYIEQVQAQIKKEKANLVYLEKQYQRAAKLLQSNDISQQEYDLYDSQYKQSKQQLLNLEANLKAYQLAARDKQINAALERVKSAQKNEENAKWMLEQTTVTSPVDAMVFDTFYWPGEQVQEFQPVVALLVPDQIKLVFYVPQPILSQFKLGDVIYFSVDGVDHPYKAKIDYISPSAEYTPPVVYSKSTRRDLSFKIEAIPTNQSQNNWHPGQPVSVYLSGDHGE
ncbi:HlyD family secretion protein [Facilibium subflavum]|uniref:HlyD family secretion protein n=1 Tax=Facilibium subflavum TaxID=2219058 RepID=UPI000E65882F|nr:HlyD family efflux transporter periplasmic adaptor subunit [Facilibium subflavum]